MDIKWKSFDHMLSDAKNEGFEINSKEGWIIPPNSSEKIHIFQDQFEPFFMGFTMGMEHVAKQVIASQE